nr:MAG TPA: hypothetical protein [Caudoviricetes sp.]
MKRLTFEGNFCDIAMCGEVPGGSFCEDGVCSQRKIWEQLKKIEDILDSEYDLDRLRELAQADREGRCVVLDDITVADLQQMLSVLDSTHYGDDAETYTTGYRNGHRNGRIEILRHVLGIHEGTSEYTEAALRREQE